MKITTIFTAFVLVALAACDRTPPEQQLVIDAAQALGGVEQVQGVTTLVMEGEGTQYNLGQDVRPDAIGQTFRSLGTSAPSTWQTARRGRN